MSPSHSAARERAQVDPADAVAEIQKNRREVIRVEFSEFNGSRYLNIRSWYRTDAGELRPTPKGFGLRLDKIVDLADALDKAVELAEKRGWL